MQISPTSFVTLHYRILLSESGSEVVSTFSDRPATLQMGVGQLAPGLEQCLYGLGEGDRKIFDLRPVSAYGERNPELLQRVSKRLLREQGADESYEIGEVVEFPSPNGGRFAGVVAEVGQEAVDFDFNHPLAGHAVKFEVQIIGVL